VGYGYFLEPQSGSTLLKPATRCVILYVVMTNFDWKQKWPSVLVPETAFFPLILIAVRSD